MATEPSAESILYPLRNAMVFDRRAFFPNEPERAPEYQVLVKWWEEVEGPIAGSSRTAERSVLGTGTTREAAAVDASEKVIAHLERLRETAADMIKRLRLARCGI